MSRTSAPAPDAAATGADMSPTGGAWLILCPSWYQPARLAAELSGVWLSPDEVASALQPRLAPVELSPDLRELAAHVIADRSADQIARELHVSRRTVQRRLARLRARLGVGSAAELRGVLSEQIRPVARASNVSQEEPLVTSNTSVRGASRHEGGTSS